jgi:hypothetical protein
MMELKPEEERKPKMSPMKAEVRPRYKCDLCNLRFVAQRNLYLHLKEHYEPSLKDTQPQREHEVEGLGMIHLIQSCTRVSL